MSNCMITRKNAEAKYKEMVAVSSHWDNSTGQAWSAIVVKKDGTILNGVVEGDYFKIVVSGDKYVKVTAKKTGTYQIKKNSGGVTTKKVNSGETIGSVGGYNPSGTDVMCILAL